MFPNATRVFPSFPRVDAGYITRKRIIYFLNPSHHGARNHCIPPPPPYSVYRPAQLTLVDWSVQVPLQVQLMYDGPIRRKPLGHEKEQTAPAELCLRVQLSGKAIAVLGCGSWRHWAEGRRIKNVTSDDGSRPIPPRTKFVDQSQRSEEHRQSKYLAEQRTIQSAILRPNQCEVITSECFKRHSATACGHESALFKCVLVGRKIGTTPKGRL